MRGRHIIIRNIANTSLLMLVLFSAVIGIFTAKNYVGYGTYANATAGEIVQLQVKMILPAEHWAGITAMVTFLVGSGIDMVEQDVTVNEVVIDRIYVFDCYDYLDSEIYASVNDTLDWSNMSPANVTDVDAWLGYLGDEKDSANQTFNRTINITLGTTDIYNVPATYTWVRGYDNYTTFPTGILKDSYGNFVFVTKISTLLKDSYRPDKKLNLQILVGVRGNNETYYLFPDPNDYCPVGAGIVANGTIEGYVVDDETSAPLANVSVYIGNTMGLTDASGFYSFPAIAGLYTVIGIKEGYLPHIEFNVTVPEEATGYYNFSMNKSIFMVPGGGGNITGFVFDNMTLLPVPNATVSANGFSILSDENGSYIFGVYAGAHIIVSFKQGYQSEFHEVNVTANNVTYQNFTLPPIAVGAVIGSGSIKGFVFDNLTHAPLPNTTISFEGRTNISDSNGSYEIGDVPAGIHNIVAVHDGYYIFTAAVNITPGNITDFNISMTQFLVTVIPPNGTLHGFVKDASNGAPLDNVTIAIGGLTTYTNITGEYKISLPAGAYYMAGIKTGYMFYVNIINITAGNVTEHNFSMVIYLPPGFGPGLGPGSGAGQGAGQGAGLGAGLGPGLGPGTGKLEKIGIDFYMSLKEIIRKIREGTFVQEMVTFYNFGDATKSVTLSVTGNVSNLVELSESALSVASNKTADLFITMKALNQSGTYKGEMLITGDANASLPITMIILPKEKLPIRALIVGVELLRDRMTPGSPLRYKVELRNLLTDVTYPVDLTYSITKPDGRERIKIGDDHVHIQTFLSLLNDYPIPKDFEIGTYYLNVEARYLNLTSTITTPFVVQLPFYRYAVFGIIPVWMIILILILSAIMAYGILEYKRIQLAKRRYVARVEFDLLPKPGPRSLYLGKVAESEKKAWYEMDLLTTHCIIAGSTGGGKTISAQDIVEEVLMKDVAVIVFDPTAQWTGLLRKCDSKKMFDLYPRFGMKVSDARAFNGNIRQITDARERIDIQKYMKPGEMQVFTLNRLEPKDIDIFMTNTIRSVFRAFFPESPVLRLLIVYDEVHRLLPRFGGSGEGFIQIERACREFRKWGIGIMLVSQVLSDFVGEIKANINTEIQMRTRDEGDLERIKTKYGGELLQSLVKAEVGTGMFVNTNYNRGNPYFISFRPILHSVRRLSDEDLDRYNKYNTIVDELEYQIEQLEKEGIDVFDLRLELKLALDKIKTGNFNMVEIYLESLVPRVRDEWRKLGKEPKKREIEVVAEEELRLELEKAKEERRKIVAEERKAVEEKVEKVLMVKKACPPSKVLTLNTGAMVSTLSELKDALSTIDPEIFRDHVNEKKNDLSRWAGEGLEFSDVADAFEKMRAAQEFVAYIEELERKKRTIEIRPAGVPRAEPAKPVVEKPVEEKKIPEKTEKIEEKPKSRLEEIGRLIDEMNRLIKAGRKNQAFEIHKRINQIYHSLSKEEKAYIYKRYMELIKRMAK